MTDKERAQAYLELAGFATQGPWQFDNGDSDAYGVIASDNDAVCYASSDPGLGTGLRGEDSDAAN